MSVRSEDVTNPLARFDLSGIPANARVVMAKLGLYSMDAEPCTKMVASSYQLLRPWDAASATWLTATQNITWYVPGANDLNVDRLDQPTYTETVRAPFTWYTWDVDRDGPELGERSSDESRCDRQELDVWQRDPASRERPRQSECG